MKKLKTLKTIALFAGISIYALNANAQENESKHYSIDLSQWDAFGQSMNKTAPTQVSYQNHTYETGNKTLSNGGKISFMKKVGSIEQDKEEEFQVSDFKFQVVPNPTSKTFYIKGNLELPVTLEIYTVIGKKVHTQALNSQNAVIDVSGLSKGLYLYKVLSEDGEFGVGKVVVE